jgi:hypothetical protein
MATTVVSDVNADAASLLFRFNIHCARIVSVESDCILFLGARDVPRTAWIAMRAGRVVAVIPETGFVVEPSGWATRQLARATAPGPDPDEQDQA